MSYTLICDVSQSANTDNVGSYQFRVRNENGSAERWEVCYFREPEGWQPMTASDFNELWPLLLGLIVSGYIAGLLRRQFG